MKRGKKKKRARAHVAWEKRYVTGVLETAAAVVVLVLTW